MFSTESFCALYPLFIAYGVEDHRKAIDPAKIHNELARLMETMFKDGFRKTIRWYLDNKQWWQTFISDEYQNYYEKMYGNRFCGGLYSEEWHKAEFE